MFRQLDYDMQNGGKRVGDSITKERHKAIGKCPDKIAQPDTILISMQPPEPTGPSNDYVEWRRLLPWDDTTNAQSLRNIAQ